MSETKAKNETAGIVAALAAGAVGLFLLTGGLSTERTAHCPPAPPRYDYTGKPLIVLGSTPCYAIEEHKLGPWTYKTERVSVTGR